MQIPLLYYTTFIIWHLSLTGCCLFAAYRLRKTQLHPPLKLSILFTLFFIAFLVLFLIWAWALETLISISFLAAAFSGLLAVCILLGAFYFFTVIAAQKETPAARKDAPACCYAQFIPQLSRREREVIAAALAGCTSYKTIADSLNISVNTVKTHLQHIYQTTGVSGIAALCSLFYGYSEEEFVN